MAITCTPTITVLDAAEKKVRIRCTISVDDGPEQIVTMEKADISTSEKKIEAANIIWKKFLVKHQKQLAQDAIAHELAALETALKTNIEGRTV